MLIEDDRTYAWLVEEMLVEAFSGETVDVVSFGSLASAIDEKAAVDCALVDLSLPDASGITVIDTVLESLPEVPMVVLTGAEDEQLALQAVERGAQDYLVKRRVDPEVLGRSVRYAIERKRAEVQRAELLRARAAHAEAAALSGMLARLQEVADAAIAVQAVERGAQDYLVKRRVDPEVLGRSVRYAIERKRAEVQRAELLRARAAHAEAAALSGMLARLQEVADAAIAVQGHLDRGELLERSLSVIAAESGALIVQPSGGAPPAIAAARGLENVSPSTRIDETGVTAEVLDSDGSLVVPSIDSGDDSTLGPKAGVRSLVAVTLEADGRRLGVLVATSSLTERFSEEQARLLALAGERCARALANAAAYERERRTAAALQAGLLPQGVPDLRHGQLAVRYLPALGGPAVGGDWYDAIVLPDGRLGLAIGDVTGHGAEAAVLMGQLRTALRAYALEGSSPDVVVSRLNALALSLGDDAMATLIYAVLDPSLTTGAFVNAGHPPPVRISADGATQLECRSSPPVGAAAGSQFEEHVFNLQAGDALCLYSDGLVEERGADFPKREQTLLDALGTPAAAEVLCERALAALRPHGAADDDVALLVLQTSETNSGLQTTHPANPEELGNARAVLREWLEGIGANRMEVSEILLAANEACMNVIEHAYEEGSGTFALEGHVDEQTVVLIVRDAGRWSEVRARGRGRGLKLMEAMMDSVQLSFSSEGTIVVLRRTLEATET